MLGEISALNSALAIIERFRKWLPKPKVPETPATRIVRLFAARGINRNLIFPMLGREVSLSDVQTDEGVLKLLTLPLIDASAKLFGIRREWLECASEQIYSPHDFYKHPESFERFLVNLQAKQRQIQINGVLMVAEPSGFEESALLVLEEPVETALNICVNRIYFCNNWQFDYWKARAYLTACVASAWRHDVFLRGRRVAIETIRRYREGLHFLPHEDGSSLPGEGLHFYPEDMAVKPESFLAGLTEGSFGRIQGLDLWLKLDTAGLMRVDLPYEKVREEFESARARQA